MALNTTTLKNDMIARLLANCNAVDDSQLAAFCQQIAEAIVEHIKQYADVSTIVATAIPVTVDPVTHNGFTTATGTAAKTAPGAIT